MRCWGACSEATTEHAYLALITPAPDSPGDQSEGLSSYLPGPAGSRWRLRLAQSAIPKGRGSGLDRRRTPVVGIGGGEDRPGGMPAAR